MISYMVHVIKNAAYKNIDAIFPPVPPTCCNFFPNLTNTSYGPLHHAYTNLIPSENMKYKNKCSLLKTYINKIRSLDKINN